MTVLAALLTLLAAVGGRGLWRDGGGGSVLRAVTERSPTGTSRDAKRKPLPPEAVGVPAVKGMTERAASKRLAEAGFEAQVRRRESPEEEDTGKVPGQSVAGGKEAKRGPKVLLTGEWKLDQQLSGQRIG